MHTPNLPLSMAHRRKHPKIPLQVPKPPPGPPKEGSLVAATPSKGTRVIFGSLTQLPYSRAGREGGREGRKGARLLLRHCRHSHVPAVVWREEPPTHGTSCSHTAPREHHWGTGTRMDTGDAVCCQQGTNIAQIQPQDHAISPTQSLKFVPISPTSLGCGGDGIEPSRDSAGLHQPTAITSHGQGKSQPQALQIS